MSKGTKAALVVDDDETLRIITRRQLVRLGFEADLAEDGKEAVDACQARQYDLILMDIQMPVLDGFEATAAIREMEAADPKRAKSIIIAMTASQEKDRALSSGMDGFLFKPFVHTELLQTVQKWFDLTKEDAEMLQ